MQKQFLDRLRALGCEGKRILLAVSGGLDSAVLLDLMVKAEFPAGVAHVNFQLRGEASEEDETWVKQRAAELNVPFYSKRFNTNNYAITKGISIQMAARA